MSGQSGGHLVRIFNGFIPLFVAAGVVFTLFVIGGKAVQSYELKQEALALERRIDGLKIENRQIKQQLEYYRSDQFIEKVAREELGLIKPGDVAVVMVMPSDNPLPALPDPVPLVSPARQTPSDIPTWQRWLQLFVGRD
jgi:cell division protein FtsL